MTKPTICVAIPIRNGARWLPESIESVLGQEDVDVRVHVVDNISDDDSVEVARRYESDGRVRVDVNTRDIGYYGSLNRILAAAQSEYFVPFACDDVMMPGNLARKLEAIEATGAGIAHSPALMVDDAGEPTGAIWPNHSQTPAVLDAPEFFKRNTPHNQVSTNAVLVGTDALRSVGGFDVRSIYASDWLTFLRLSLRVRVATLHEPLVRYRIHEQTGRSTMAQIKGRDLPATLDRVFRDPAFPREWLGMRDRLMADHYLEIAVVLKGDGVNRIGDGWGAYMAMGRRLMHLPDGSEAFEEYRQFISAAGLIPPMLPVEAVAFAPASAEDAAALAGAAAELGARLGRLIVCVEPDRVEEAMRLLGPHFEDAALDVGLFPTPDGLAELRPGRLVLAPWGSELIAQSEERAVPVFPYAIPNPFDRPLDPELWETVDASACLA